MSRDVWHKYFQKKIEHLYSKKLLLDISGKEKLYSKSLDSRKNGCLSWTLGETHGRKHWLISGRSEQWEQNAGPPSWASPSRWSGSQFLQLRAGLCIRSTPGASFCESRITSDVTLHCCWTLLQVGIGLTSRRLWLFFSPAVSICIYICFWPPSWFIHSANANHSSVVDTPSSNYSSCLLEEWSAGWACGNPGILLTLVPALEYSVSVDALYVWFHLYDLCNQLHSFTSLPEGFFTN